MTSRERVLTTIARREPDRVPYNLRPSHELLLQFRAHVGEGDFADHFGHDVRYVSLALPERPAHVPEDQWTPTPTPADIAATAVATARLHGRGLAVCGAYACGVFEQAKAWLGDEGALVAPFEDPAGLARTLDRITEWKASIYGAYAEAGVDIVWMGDDLGSQRSLVMSPEHYRQWYRPRHQELVEHIRWRGPSAQIAFHCCGHVTPLIPDLIEMGIDVLEAVQAEAMDIAQLKREFGRDISFWGGVGAQSILARTEPDEVMAGVRDALAIMAPGGGYIAAPCHTLTDEVPWASVIAFHEAVVRFGGYG
ncbi:MAG TPA: uroporphyrinogen decarboxylase family protein [Armatimonadota bacterium]|nr:uroporphyrinogen decarboxylase family protein [Armatimonadota bacterium]